MAGCACRVTSNSLIGVVKELVHDARHMHRCEGAPESVKHKARKHVDGASDQLGSATAGKVPELRNGVPETAQDLR
jgi:hypothetical protein